MTLEKEFDKMQVSELEEHISNLKSKIHPWSTPLYMIGGVLGGYILGVAVYDTTMAISYGQFGIDAHYLSHIRNPFSADDLASSFRNFISIPTAIVGPFVGYGIVRRKTSKRMNEIHKVEVAKARLEAVKDYVTSHPDTQS